MINLGDKVKCKITGMVGIVTGYHKWLTGCDRISVQSQELHEGKPQDAQGFDVSMVTLVESSVIKSLNTESSTNTAKSPGGPRGEPSRRVNPK